MFQEMSEEPLVHLVHLILPDTLTQSLVWHLNLECLHLTASKLSGKGSCI